MPYSKWDDGQQNSANSKPVTLSTEQEAKIDLLATKAKQDLLLAELELKADLTEAQPVELGKIMFTYSNANSTSTQLAAGASFFGTVADGLSHPNLILSVRCDQPFTLTIKQYNDLGGTVAYPDIVITRKANENYNNTILLTGSFFKVDIRNDGQVTSTLLFLETWLGILPVTPQLTNNNNTPIAIQEVANNSIRKIFRTSFAKTLASTVDSTFFNTIKIGSGQAISQGSGNLLITTGTTVNSETVLRSKESFFGSTIVRAQTLLSQRIVNNNFVIELVDVIGDNLTTTISSATAIVVTIPNNPFTSENVGQSMWVGAYTGTGTFVPQKAVIASVSGTNVTYTVASMAAGSGTCSVFGWNYYQSIYTGTTATSVNYDTQRNGWSSAVGAATINTTATPGHMLIMSNDDGNAYLLDQLVASATALQQTIRASRVINLPTETIGLFLQIRTFNGTTAPASTTTWTVGMTSVENFSPVPTTINNVKPQGVGNTMPVNVTNTVPVSGTITANIGSGSLAAGTNLVGDVGLQYRANATGASSRTHLVSAATTNPTTAKASGGRLVGWSISNTTASWRYVKLHNQATAPTAGSGVVFTIGIPPNSVRELAIDGGIGFTTGIGMTTVTGGADADATAVGAGDLIIDLFWA